MDAETRYRIRRLLRLGRLQVHSRPMDDWEVKLLACQRAGHPGHAPALCPYAGTAAVVYVP